MPFFNVEKTRYNYIVAGAGEPLLLLHGFTGSVENWCDVMAQLQSRHHVFAIDLPGHGMTQGPNEVAQYAMPVVARQISAFIAQIIGKPTALLGYSMGGRLGLCVALDHSDHLSALILESASPGIVTGSERQTRQVSDEALAMRIERDGIENFVDTWERLPLFASQAQVSVEARDRLRALRLRNDPAGLALSLRGMGTAAQPSLWNRLNEWTKPALLISGELDAKFVQINQHMTQRIPNATHHIVANAGHAVHFEQPDLYTSLLQRFI